MHKNLFQELKKNTDSNVIENNLTFNHNKLHYNYMKYFYILFLLTLSISAQEKVTLDYYLPNDETYNASIPTPKSVFGFELGEWHTDYNQVLLYIQKVAAVSNRIKIETTGFSHENRPLQLLTISSAKNIENSDAIKANHVAKTINPSIKVSDSDPVVVYLGYTIHGNEPSGTGAAIALVYYLAAAEGKNIDELLNNTIILLDPCLNPDGLHRFAGWVNSQKSKTQVTDSNDREFSEGWPSSRFNHYWFDMNRDWLALQHPESQARIKTFQNWMPNVLGDFHEMGTNATYFFQPGIQSRTHPLTPKMNQELTKSIATYHAKAMDKIGSFYYSEESFDDFYFGKGSTYPDINGAIGILFEQASSRGHAQESVNGVVTFPFTIRNQFTTSISTLVASYEMRKELLNYQRDFFSNASRNNGFLFGDENEASKVYELAKILDQHQIKLVALKEDITHNKKKFKKESSYLIPGNQRNIKLVEAIFDKRTQFSDSLFYDISSWSLDLAFNVDFESYSNTASETAYTSPHRPTGGVSSKSEIAYLFESNSYYTPKLLYQLLKKDIRVKVSKKPLTYNQQTFSYGSLLIPVQNQKFSGDELFKLITELAIENSITITGVSTGLTEGINLGSPSFSPVELPKVALIVGQNVTPADAGEIWHLFDVKMEIPITKIDINQLSGADLSKYNTIIMVNGNYNSISNGSTKNLEQWVDNGGILIGFKNAIKWLSDSKFTNLTFKTNESIAKGITYENKDDFKDAQVIGGAIFETTLDLSHPIAYGFKSNKLPVFRNSTLFMEIDKNSYNNPIIYTKSPLLSGYISKENLNQLKETAAFKASRKGKGVVLSYTDIATFRGFWLGTEKLLWNGIFFGKLMP